MSSGKGGKADTSAMMKYGDKALDLQEKIYKEQRQDVQPWYQAGTQAVGQLQNLLGLGGTGSGTSATSRQQLIDQYTPQFTAQNTSSGTFDPKLMAEYSDLNSRLNAGSIGQGGEAAVANARNRMKELEGMMGPQQASTTDVAGLNAYVDDLIAKQQEAASSDPNFGKLAKNFTMEDYQADPGYAFRLAEGNKALERKLNASGKTFSPEAAKALLTYNQDMGSQEYANAYNRYNIDQDTLFNRLAAISGYGQTASGQLAGAGANYANAGSNILTSQGNALTAAQQASGGSSMFQNLLSAIGTGAQAYAAFSDRRLKTDIEEIGEENGHKTYSFVYKDDPSRKKYIGVLAQNVLDIDPLAVVMDESGYYKVDYNKIGIQMREA